MKPILLKHLNENKLQILNLKFTHLRISLEVLQGKLRVFQGKSIIFRSNLRIFQIKLRFIPNPTSNHHEYFKVNLGIFQGNS